MVQMLMWRPALPSPGEIAYLKRAASASIAVVQVLPILLVCIFLTKYLFKSAEGIGGAVNG